ncbi:MAG: hypothetical protein A3C84_04565 [Candidatus Ryanbacteria bacterium RIFCSPHIGHO2_02_FULL_48_12]|uniref:Uncharacterized protein n=1 Tax=Candidatus Ryanbacteria bacterium RIFCSPHIGHO2_01_FULL_48_27 TaxID=1802115 RepID=A0A1G2G633_9BACT|nr:MAG: hypothetical protein A2756_02235 [Candidatus Ryanbacteria bacterium RIFCSPHIGHO2_01_FULL_48_27]OGZ49852.1 MAG: hypothetical protein A3C84_04565 [Candidatus Ryanbacteria bacterium RIFCSPHIGHO2_02_FULL_48_12]
MASQISKDVQSHGVKISQPRKEEAEYGKTKKGMQACKKCHAYFYKKSWHHDLPGVKKGEKKPVPVFTFTLCPACQMIQNRQYEGKVIVDAAPAHLLTEIINLINAYGARAYHADTQHRIIKVQNAKSGITVTTTENQLAIKLAKKIKATFHASKLMVIHLKDPSDVELARVIFAMDMDRAKSLKS